jgi:sulfur carrier protein
VIVRVNGDLVELPTGCTVATLLELLGANPKGVAVAVNNEVLPRAVHGERRLMGEDRVEVIRAVGGG